MIEDELFATSPPITGMDVATDLFMNGPYVQIQPLPDEGFRDERGLCDLGF